MKKPIILLLLTGSLKKGGAEKRIISLYKYLDKTEVKVYVGSFSNIFQMDSLNYLKANIFNLGKRGLIPLFSFLRMLRLIRSIKPGIVFGNLVRVNVLTLVTIILSIRLPSKIVIGVSNNPKFHPNPMLTRFLYKRAPRLIVNSHGIKNYLSNQWGLDDRNIHVIHNGVNSNEIISLTEDDSVFEWYKESLPVIITIGRLYPQKNHACLIKAFSIVSKKIESRLIIIGEGPLRQSLVKLARSVGVAEYTWFAGYQVNPYKFLSRSSLFTLSSKWEGFPNVLLEAMVCGVPVISTDIDFGPREIINHGETGFLVQNDDPVALADQIHYILKNRREENIKVIINNARKKVEAEFSSEMMIKKYHEYFVNVYSNRYAELHSKPKV